jgi:hypothetical protein
MSICSESCRARVRLPSKTLRDRGHRGAAESCRERTHAPQQTLAQRRGLFDHLVGRGQQTRRHFKAERPGRLQVDDELEFGRLQDRQIRGLRAPEDLTGVDAGLTVHVYNICPIAHQSTDFDNLARGIGRGNRMARRKRRKLDAPADKERVGSNEERVGSLAHHGGEGRIDLAAGAGVDDLNLQSETACSFGYLSQRGLGIRRTGRIDQNGNLPRVLAR